MWSENNGDRCEDKKKNRKKRKLIRAAVFPISRLVNYLKHPGRRRD